MERHCTIGDIEHLGRAWVLPHPERRRRASRRWCATRRSSGSRSAAIEHEEARGWVVESVENENRGFDLISRKPHPTERRSLDVRFIEVKGRAGVGEVALSERVQDRRAPGADYWLYVVFNCGATPKLHAVQNPSKLRWEPKFLLSTTTSARRQFLTPHGPTAMCEANG